MTMKSTTQLILDEMPKDGEYHDVRDIIHGVGITIGRERAVKEVPSALGKLAKAGVIQMDQYESMQLISRGCWRIGG